MKEKVGSLWINPKHDGNPKAPMLTGNVEIEGVRYRMAIWKNREKKTDKHPDYRIVFEEYREMRQQSRYIDRREEFGDDVPW